MRRREVARVPEPAKRFPSDVWCFMCQGWERADRVSAVWTEDSDGREAEGEVCATCTRQLERLGKIDVMRDQYRVEVRLLRRRQPRRPSRLR